MKTFKKALLVLVVVVLALLALGFFVWKNQKLVIKTEKKEYASKENLKLKVENHYLNKEFCFSSCYPYLLEKKKEIWQTYVYEECPFPNMIETCIRPRQLKAFIVNLPMVGPGTHRVVVPVCENCRVGQEFKETNKFFSNEFEIK